ncbi:hypothetical protein ACRAWF_24885 [Streptomyces sp. L7]
MGRAPAAGRRAQAHRRPAQALTREAADPLLRRPASPSGGRPTTSCSSTGFPLGATGKMLKLKLREQFKGHKAAGLLSPRLPATPRVIGISAISLFKVLAINNISGDRHELRSASPRPPSRPAARCSPPSPGARCPAPPAPMRRRARR